MLKTILKLTFGILIFGMMFPSAVLAVDIANPTGSKNLSEIIGRVTSITTPLSIVAFLFCVIYAGWIKMTAGGNPEKEALWMKWLTSAMVGFAIIALAPFIVNLIGRLIGTRMTLVT